MWIAIIVLFVTLIAMACCEGVRRSFPTNFIFLGLFTLAQTFMLGMMTSRVPADTVSRRLDALPFESLISNCKFKSRSYWLSARPLQCVWAWHCSHSKPNGTSPYAMASSSLLWSYSWSSDLWPCSFLAALCNWFMLRAVHFSSVSTWYTSKCHCSHSRSRHDNDWTLIAIGISLFAARNWWWGAATSIPSVPRSTFSQHWTSTWILSIFSFTFWPFCRRRETEMIKKKM